MSGRTSFNRPKMAKAIRVKKINTDNPRKQPSTHVQTYFYHRNLLDFSAFFPLLPSSSLFFSPRITRFFLSNPIFLPTYHPILPLPPFSFPPTFIPNVFPGFCSPPERCRPRNERNSPFSFVSNTTMFPKGTNPHDSVRFKNNNVTEEYDSPSFRSFQMRGRGFFLSLWGILQKT